MGTSEFLRYLYLSSLQAGPGLAFSALLAGFSGRSRRAEGCAADGRERGHAEPGA